MRGLFGGQKKRPGEPESASADHASWQISPGDTLSAAVLCAILLYPVGAGYIYGYADTLGAARSLFGLDVFETLLRSFTAFRVMFVPGMNGDLFLPFGLFLLCLGLVVLLVAFPGPAVVTRGSVIVMLLFFTFLFSFTFGGRAGRNYAQALYCSPERFAMMPVRDIRFTPEAEESGLAALEEAVRRGDLFHISSIPDRYVFVDNRRRTGECVQPMRNYMFESDAIQFVAR